MSARVSKNIRLSQWWLVVFATFSVALHPGFVLKWDEGGFSNYGIHIRTTIPYSLALLGSAYFAFRAAGQLINLRSSARHFSLIVATYGVLMILTLVSTYGYTRNADLKNFHTAVDIVTMVFEPVASVWMYRRLRTTPWTRTLLTLELLGLATGTIDYFALLHVLFIAQVLTAFAFGALFIRSASRLDEVRSRAWSVSST